MIEMEQGKLTPERQLLKLIEEPKAGVYNQKAAIKYRSLKLFSVAVLKGRFYFFREKIKRIIAEWRQFRFDFKVFNHMLEFSIALLIIYVVSSFLLSVIHLKKMAKSEIKIEKVAKQPLELKLVSFLKAPSYYLAKARNRDIFRMGKIKTEDTGVVIPEPLSSEIIELTKNLTIVGISWSGDPDILIEDTEEKRTYFLKRGQMIKGLKVEAIFKDRVILSYQGEEIELR